MSRLLITGAAGRIGKVVVAPLASDWQVRCADTNAAGLARYKEFGCEVVACDICDAAETSAAVDGCDAVLHLAAISEEADAALIARVNVVGTTNVLDACREHGVRRFVFASSNHAVGGYERYSEELPPKVMVDEHSMPWPDSHYGASKVHGEALTRWYVARPGSHMTAACLRIGTTGFPEVDKLMRNERMWSTWLSDRDLVQLVSRALEAQVPFGIYGGVSGNKRRFLSLQAAQRDLGYVPQDDAELLAADRNFDSDGYSFAPWQE